MDDLRGVEDCVQKIEKREIEEDEILNTKDWRELWQEIK